MKFIAFTKLYIKSEQASFTQVYRSDSLGKQSPLGFPKLFPRSTFSLSDQISNYGYGIWVSMRLLCSKLNRVQREQDL